MYDMYTNGYNENWYTHKTMNVKKYVGSLIDVAIYWIMIKDLK